MKQEALNLLWAKKNNKTGKYHPLICHLIDCGSTAKAIWDHVLTLPFKNNLSNFFNLSEDETRNWVSFICSMHDIGKASPTFQSKDSRKKAMLEESGLQFPPLSTYIQYKHDLISAWCIEDLLINEQLMGLEDAQKIAQMTGAHHGFFYTASDFYSKQKRRNIGGEAWETWRGEIFNKLKTAFKINQTAILGDTDLKGHASVVILCGIMVVADWLCSNEDYFKYCDPFDLPLEDYAKIANDSAFRALEKTGWKTWKPEGSSIGFNQMFTHLNEAFSANLMQETVIDLTRELVSPFLAIIEAPTGDGKTESALYLADQTIQKNLLRGLYVAMPSMATSNQMFERVSKFLKARYPNQLINLQLAHSQALWNDLIQKMQVSSIAPDYGEEVPGTTAMTWFFPKKRTLLAPFGVGTVDQGLMSILQVKHFFLRLFGLSHKVLIFDEVHAYDLYMSTLFLHLLTWLKALDCSVIILSATLPIKTRESMIKTFNNNWQIEENNDYPRITLASETAVQTKILKTSRDQHYKVKIIGNGVDEIIDNLKNNLRTGGCATVICNTVTRAQEVFSEIAAAGLINEANTEEVLILFHARFPFLWRQKIENKVLRLFGKERQHRPKKAILVATQVIEQSLDLDFDIMISELAPIDLILQRAGRLHRHENHTRPEELKEAQLIISSTNLNQNNDFGPAGYIYDNPLLLLSFYYLINKNTIKLPLETREMIEFVYGKGYKDKLEKEKIAKVETLEQELAKQQESETRTAKSKMIPTTGDESFLYMGRPTLEEDNPEIHRAFQALTRLSNPSIHLICLKEENGIITTLDGKTKVDFHHEPKDDEVKALLQSCISIQNYKILKFFWENKKKHQFWEEPRILKDYYTVIFNNGRCELNNSLSLYLDENIGLKYEL